MDYSILTGLLPCEKMTLLGPVHGRMHQDAIIVLFFVHLLATTPDGMTPFW